MLMHRTVIVLFDSLGIGYSEDAYKFQDHGSNTLGHIIDTFPNIQIPSLRSLGLLKCLNLSSGFQIDESEDLIQGTMYGYAKELGSGKDTVSGHWELMGCPVNFDWGLFLEKKNSFPKELINRLISEAKIENVLGNCIASGTEIIKQYGSKHIETGYPIVYTSADSVIQIAAHEESFGLSRLYQVCKAARKIADDYHVGRVIARPFIGTNPKDFLRTGNRKDYTTPPHNETLIDVMYKNGFLITAVGKIADIFAHRNINKSIKATGLTELFDATIDAIQTYKKKGLVFTNLVDFDAVYGHRRDVKGYKEALEYADHRLGALMKKLNPDDLLVVTADHGCDPTWIGTDHTREHIPIIFYNKKLNNRNLGFRTSFADVGQSIADFMGLGQILKNGKSFI